jgi:hypothetical protein
MKYYILIAFLSFFTLTNCSVGNDNSEPQTIRVLWNLENVSGGISGVDHDFNTGVIVWEFYIETSNLIVKNTNSDSSLEDGLNTGTYTFSTFAVGTDTYLKIGGNEVGSLTLVGDNTLVINQNETSTGPAADGYIYTFKKTVIVEN